MLEFEKKTVKIQIARFLNDKTKLKITPQEPPLLRKQSKPGPRLSQKKRRTAQH
jgi:hypothetical protein